jgi:hypothetical protein
LALRPEPSKPPGGSGAILALAKLGLLLALAAIGLSWLRAAVTWFGYVIVLEVVADNAPGIW